MEVMRREGWSIGNGKGEVYFVVYTIMYML